MKWQSFLPALEWLPGYDRQTFRHDLVAGLTVWVMLVPQGMAYALLAGMPPIYGLYGGLVPVLLYGLFGTSRQLSIGPVAVSALLVLAGISPLAEPGSPEFISLVLLTGLLIGIVQVIMGLLRFGFLVNFLSHPVIIGFTSAAAVIIAISQLKYLLGFPIPRFEHFYETVGYALGHWSQIHWPTFALCVGAIFLILFFRRVSRLIPGALVVTVLGIALAAIFGLDRRGVQLVGEVPEGLPGFALVGLSRETVAAVLPTVFTVTIIGIVESVGIAKLLEAKKDYKVRPDQELLALGLSKVGGAFFQALPTSGSFTRSAVNDNSGAKTGMSSIITAGLIGLTLLVLTPAFYYLPETVLGAIVLVAVKGLFDVKEAVHLWHLHRGDFFMMLATFLFTLVLGIEEGVLIGVALSIFMVIFRSSRPHVAILGQLPNTDYYRNIDRFENAIQDEGILIVRFDDQLYFGNADYFSRSLTQLASAQDRSLRLFLLDASGIQDMDSSGLRALEEVMDTLAEKGVRFMISGAIGPVRDLLFKSGLMDRIGKGNHFMHIRDAVDAFKQANNGQAAGWTASAIQTNIDRKK